jgi:hypothetical protein
MASATELSNVLVAAMLDNAVNVSLNAGTGNAIINIYDDTSTMPADCEASNGSNVLLGTCVMGVTPFDAATDETGSAQIAASLPITNDPDAVAGGTAAYFRAYSSDAGTDASKLSCHIQGTAGEAADSTDLTLDVKLIVIGGSIAVTAWTIDMPES